MTNAIAAAPMRKPLMSIVKRGKVKAPVRVLLYAVDGVGKTTFAANAPNPIFLCAESGTYQFDVARLPEPTSWSNALELIDQLCAEEHDFETFVVDSVSWLEPLLHAEICARSRKKSMAEFDYGKGHIAAFEGWRIFLSKVERLWKERGMNVVFLAHAHTATVKNPAGADYGVISPKLHALADGALREWSDAVLYAEYQTFEISGDPKRSKVISDGARVVHTQHGGAYRAKNRYNLPETLPLDWHAFMDAVAAGSTASPDTLRARIARLLDGADDVLTGKVAAAVKNAGDDAARLARIADKLAAEIGIAAAQTQGDGT